MLVGLCKTRRLFCVFICAVPVPDWTPFPSFHPHQQVEHEQANEAEPRKQRMQSFIDINTGIFSFPNKHSYNVALSLSAVD